MTQSTTHVVVPPGPAMLWDPETTTVTAVKVDAPAFYRTAYLVYCNGNPVGFVASRPERGHATLWGYAKSLDGFLYAGSPSRASACEALL